MYSRTRDLIDLNCPEKIPMLLRFLADVMEEKSRTQAFSRSFNYIKIMLNSDDPYRKKKKELNRAARTVISEIRRYLTHKSWDLREAFRVSAAANIIDTSVLGYESRNLVEAVWERPVLEMYIDLPKHIYLVLDNAGEALVDLVLAEALSRRGHDVTLVVRKESYEIDVLKDDVEAEGIEIIETPGNAPPVLHIDGFLMAKGIANAEACMECEKTRSIHLLRAKCDVLAEMFEVPRNAPIIISGDGIKTIYQKFLRKHSSKHENSTV